MSVQVEPEYAPPRTTKPFHELCQKLYCGVMEATLLPLILLPVGVRKVRLKDWVVFLDSKRMTRGVILKSPKLVCPLAPVLDAIGISVAVFLET